MSFLKVLWYSNWNFSNTYIFEGKIKNSFEANIITKGVVEFSAKDKVFRLCPGDMVVCPPNTYHCTRVVSEEGADFTAIHFNINSTDFENNFFGCFRLSYHSAMLSKVLIEEITEQGGVVTDIANNVFEALFLRCIRESDDTALVSKNSSATIYRDAINFMNENMGVILSVPEIAHNCGICETTLKNAFKHHTGKSVKKFYSELKTEKASELLCEGINAKEVAATLGFSTLSYFSQFFKRETGCTIRDFLKQNEIS